MTLSEPACEASGESILTMKWFESGRDELPLIRDLQLCARSEARMSRSSSLPMSDHFMVKNHVDKTARPTDPIAF
jgi:hypothetical protein